MIRFFRKTIAGLGATVAAAVLIIAGITALPKFMESWHVHRLENGNENTQSEAAEWLVSHKTAEGLYQLTRQAALRGEQSPPYEVWLRTVKDWKLSFLEVLIRAIRDQDVAIRKLAMRAMVEIGPEGKRAVPALTQAIHDPDLIVRKSALFSLRSIGPDARAAIPAVTGILQSDDLEAGNVAALALGRIGPDAESVIPLLKAAVDNPSLRWSAILGLASIGEKAAPVLKELLHHSRFDVRRVARELLEKSKSLEEWRRKNQGEIERLHSAN